MSEKNLKYLNPFDLLYLLGSEVDRQLQNWFPGLIRTRSEYDSTFNYPSYQEYSGIVSPLPKYGPRVNSEPRLNVVDQQNLDTQKVPIIENTPNKDLKAEIEKLPLYFAEKLCIQLIKDFPSSILFYNDHPEDEVERLNHEEIILRIYQYVDTRSGAANVAKEFIKQHTKSNLVPTRQEV